MPFALAVWPWESGFQWPWDAAQATASMLIMAAVGLLIASVGVLVLVGLIPMPFGNWGRWIVGFIVLAIGVLMAFGYVGGVV